MLWQLPVFLRVLAAHFIFPVLAKNVSQTKAKAKNICVMFGWCLILSLIAGFATGTAGFSIGVIGIGLLNSVGVFCYWKAIDTSLSKTSIFTQLDDIITIFLGYVILNEARYLNTGIISGGSMCILASVLFLLIRNQKQTLQLYMWISIYSVMWGICTFSLRYFAVQEMPMCAFLASWYGGGLIGEFFIWLIFMRKKEQDIKIPLKQVHDVFFVALFVWLSLLLQYWANMHAPTIVVQPIFQVTEMVFPSLIGLFYFKEGKQLKPMEWCAFIVGIIGGLVIAFSY